MEKWKKVKGKMEKSLMEKWRVIEKINEGRFLSGEDMLLTHPTFYQYYGSRFIWSKVPTKRNFFFSSGQKIITAWNGMLGPLHIGDWKNEIFVENVCGPLSVIRGNLNYHSHNILNGMGIYIGIVLFYVITRHRISLEVKITNSDPKKLNIFNFHSSLKISVEVPFTCHSPLKSLSFLLYFLQCEWGFTIKLKIRPLSRSFINYWTSVSRNKTRSLFASIRFPSYPKWCSLFTFCFWTFESRLQTWFF